MSERDIGDEIIEGLQNAIDFAKGDPSKGRETIVQVPSVDVKAIRENLGLTQKEFALFYGFKLSALRNWEQGRRLPDRCARLLLAIIEREPQVIREVIESMEEVENSTLNSASRSVK